MKVILLIMIGLSILQAAYTKSGNIVTDSVTGLEWQDDAVGAITTWQGAITRCEALTLDTHSDWRLPNLNELTSIVDDTRSYPSVDPTFQNTISNAYWSSTTSASNSSSAWLVSFDRGVQNGRFFKTDNDYVRCVRAGQ